jgi:hypothetical protein
MALALFEPYVYVCSRRFAKDLPTALQIYAPMSAAHKSPKEAYELMLAKTQTAINRLLSAPLHYEAVRLKRNRAWAILLLAFATARTRLETVVSPDLFVEQAIESFLDLLNQMVQSDEPTWQQAFSEQKVVLDTIGCLFCPPDIETNPQLLIPSIDPMTFTPPKAYEHLFSDKPIATADDIMARLIDRNVRRLCTTHALLGSAWASALEQANWWRLCVTLSPAPQPPADAQRLAESSLQRLRQAMCKYIETFSPQIDQTDDSDDFEVRAETVRQNFKLDVHAYHRSYETAAERREKMERIIESRMHVLQ